MADSLAKQRALSEHLIQFHQLDPAFVWGDVEDQHQAIHQRRECDHTHEETAS